MIFEYIIRREIYWDNGNTGKVNIIKSGNVAMIFNGTTIDGEQLMMN